MSKISVYLHIPFCQKRCNYCDFNTYSGLSDLYQAYCEAMSREISEYAHSHYDNTKEIVHTIYFGGGTPSILPISLINIVLKSVKDNFKTSDNCEITLEANPGTLTYEKLEGLFNIGINRISLGVQSADNTELKLLGRIHSFFEVEDVVRMAREVGFANLNFDLIYGLPGQTIESWLATLDRSLEFSPEHLSIYSLTVEEGTGLKAQIDRGELSEIDPDIAADMYEESRKILDQEGYVQYEISNWAKQADNIGLMSSQHNLQYWKNLSYLGFGAGAHGYYGGYRMSNALDPKQYIDLCNSNLGGSYPFTLSTVDWQLIDRITEMRETMMMGLRLVKFGVSRKQFSKRFGTDLFDVFPAQVKKLKSLGLLEWDNGNDILRLTHKGVLLGNQVFIEFV